ncbi:MAG: triose-phosphate isomerase [Candidatus Moraniibacteriota bacterium]
MHKSLLVGNFKMNPTSQEEVDQYLAVLKREAGNKRFTRVEAILCPPDVFLSKFDTLPEGFHSGAQNMFWEKSGAFTGEISPAMLKSLGIDYVILGHSERRALFGETDEIVKQKVDAALKHFLVPIVCVGESRVERDQGQLDTVLQRQLQSIFAGVSKLQAGEIVLAYEPRWAIGTDILPTTSEILQVRILIKKILGELFDGATAEKTRVLYGGSVKHAFLAAVSWEAQMDGVLVGRESLSPYEMIKMAESLEAAESEHV